MARAAKRLMALAASCAVLLASPPAGAQTPAEREPSGPNPAVAAFDVVVLRPLGFAAAALGAVFFVPAALLTAPGGRDRLEEALEVFVLVPGKQVFERPLGEF